MSEVRSESVLFCAQCQLGFADCRCPLSEVSVVKLEERAAEIRRVTGAVLRDMALREPEPVVMVDGWLRLPGDLVETLEVQAKGESLSVFMVRLLMTWSARAASQLVFRGSTTRVYLRVPKALWERLGARATTAEMSVSALVTAHLSAELSALLEET